MKPIEEKPSRNEDEYFVKLDAELIKQRRAQLDEERAQRERAAHINKCPRCGGDLQEVAFRTVTIDRCPDCGGAWLDAGELEMLLQAEEGGIRGALRDLLGLRMR
jgi:hypothetical protein